MGGEPHRGEGVPEELVGEGGKGSFKVHQGKEAFLGAEALSEGLINVQDIVKE